MKKRWKYGLATLFLVTVVVWLAFFSLLAHRSFRLIACDVGQGDAILIVYGSIEVLTDGGPPNGKVIECLSKYMPFWDKEVEVVVNTHPQLDHYGGLLDVFRNYKVDYFVANALESSSPEYQLLKKEVGSNNVVIINPQDGTSIRYGMMHYDIFWPSEEFLASEGWDRERGILGTFASERDPNDFSVQAVISFGSFKSLLTGDIGQSMSPVVIKYYKEKSVNYIKIPHHGSKYGMTTDYLRVANPEMAVISVGKNNRYGHPTEEVLDLLDEKGVKVFRTDKKGDVVVESDGEKYWIAD